MDVLTDTMSTTQMQSKAGRVDSYDVMVEAERKMYSILDAASDDFFAGYKTGEASQAAVKAEDDAYDEEDAIRRDASYDFYGGYRVGKTSQAGYKTGKASHIRRDAFNDAYDAKYKAEKALQAAVEAENDEDDAIDKLFRKKNNSMRAARRDALIEFKKDHHV